MQFNLPKILKPWQSLFLALVVAAGAVLAGYYYLRPSYRTPADMVTLLPRSDAVVFYADVAALRDAGLLARLTGSRAAEESDYQHFVTQAHFDYQRDVDAIAVASLPNQTFAVLRGRFAWKSLSAYAVQHGGQCHNSFCAVRSSDPNRWVSFFPIRSNIMGLAVSPDESAAYALLPRRGSPAIQVPAAPVWAWLPRRVVANPADLPAGAEAFALAIEPAERVTLSLSAQKSSAPPLHLTLQLSAECASAANAAQLKDQLERITRTLRGLIAREHQQPNPADLSGMLVAGRFSQADKTVAGVWQVPPELVDALTK